MGLILKKKLKINPRSSDLDEDCSLSDLHTQVSNDFVPALLPREGSLWPFVMPILSLGFPGTALGQIHKILRAIQRIFSFDNAVLFPADMLICEINPSEMNSQ